MSNPEVQRYAKLGKTKRRKSDFQIGNGLTSNISPPKDSYNAIYLSFVLGGAGFLFPYNSFIMAMDYFKVRYPDSPVVFDMSLVYIIVAFLTVLGNNLLVETFTLNARINFGYIMSFVTLIFVVICEVWWEAFGTSTSYTVNLGAVAIVAVGCTVQQSSFYGYTSMLPARYTQAVMVGESASGVFTSSVRVLTRFLVSEIRGSTIYFFTVSVSAVATCFAMYHLIRRTDFIQYYMALCDTAKTRITLEPTEDAGLIETNDVQYGVLKLQSSPPPTSTGLSFANPAYEPSSSNPTYKVEDVVVRRGTNANSGGGLRGMKRGLQSRWEITKAVYPYMISICLAYFVTLCLYPGIASEIISCRLGSWMPILMMAIFNFADLFGKILASSTWQWTSDRLVRLTLVRVVMIPLMLMCIIPRRNPEFSSEIFPFMFALILGLTNGIFGSVPMIKAPSKIEESLKELTGNLMTLSYNFGLTIGSLMAYLLEQELGSADDHLCGPNPLHVKPNQVLNKTTNFITTSSSVSTTFLSTLQSLATTASYSSSVSVSTESSRNMSYSTLTG